VEYAKEKKRKKIALERNTGIRKERREKREAAGREEQERERRKGQ